MPDRHFLKKLILTGACAALLMGCAGSASVQEEEQPQDYIMTEEEAGQAMETVTTAKPEDQEKEEEIAQAVEARQQEQDESLTELRLLDPSLPRDRKNYTVMIYMIGSNLESGRGFASLDLMEIAGSGLDFEKTNVLAYTGGTRYWKTGIPNDRNCVLDMSRPDGERIVASTGESADMGDPYTLLSYLDFAWNNYPADHFALIFWDHGNGPLWGYGSDELFNGDAILLSEMNQALSQSPFLRKNRLDWIGFDACLMADLEIMTMWSSYADYYVASQEYEPGNGWDYSWLSVLNTTSEPKEITGAIVETYKDFYRAARSEYSNPDVTLSVIDLSRIKRLNKAVDALFARLETSLDQGKFSAIQKTRTGVKGFGHVVSGSQAGTSLYDLADAASLARAFSEMAPEESQKVITAIGDTVVLSYANVENAAGISLYYPLSNKTLYMQFRNVFQFDWIGKAYGSFIKKMARIWLKGKTGSWIVQAPVRGEDGYQVTLTGEQVEDVSSACYYILKKDEDSHGYAEILSEGVLDLSGDTLYLPADPLLFKVVTDYGTENICSVRVAESTASRNLYTTFGTSLYHGHLLTGDTYDSAFQKVSVSMQENLKTGQVSMRSVISQGGTAEMGSKDLINVTEYDGILTAFSYYMPSYNSDGTLQPCTEWNQNAYSTIDEIQVGDSFKVEPLHVSQTGGDYYYQVILEDIYGNRTASNLTRIRPERDFYEKSVRTVKGLLEYYVYKDHAELALYSGRDTALVLPDYVDDLPVTRIGGAFGRFSYGYSTGYNILESITLPSTLTEIGPHAFFWCRNLKEIQIPDGVTRIGADAFCSCQSLTRIQLPKSLQEIGPEAFAFSGLTSLALPSGLEKIGEGAFEGCTALQSFTLTDNPFFCLKDGCLYSADKKTLFAYACGRPETDLVLEEGLTEIRRGTFQQAGNLQKVTLPSTLTSIGSFAFYDCRSLVMPALPEGLARIGSFAFDCASWAYRDEDFKAEPALIKIGPALAEIGRDAFGIFEARTYEVSEENPWFSSSGGCLLNKAGDVLVDFAVGRNLNLVLPGTVTDFDFDCLGFVKNLSMDPENSYDLFLTDTVQRFTMNTEPDAHVRIHVPQGSTAAMFCETQGLTYTLETEQPVKSVTLETAEGTCVYLLYQTHAALTAYQGLDRTLQVPETVEGLPVTTIGSGSEPIQVRVYNAGGEETLGEGQSRNLKEILLPDTVRILNDRAFADMDLDQIRLPEGLEYIGARALACRVRIDRLPAGLKTIRSEGIQYLTTSRKDKKLVLPAGLEKLDTGAFSNVIGIERFAIKKSNPHYRVKEGVLYSKDGTRLVLFPAGRTGESFKVPGGTEVVSSYAFTGCRIKEIRFAGSVKELEDYAFSSSYVESVKFGKNLLFIGDRAFQYCSKLAKADFTESVSYIGDYAFYNCTALQDLQLVEGLIYIGDCAFSRDPLIHAVALPSSLVYVGNQAFYDYGSPVRQGEERKIKIGSEMEFVGSRSFASLPISAFSVSKKNEAFASREGFLTDKAGKILLQAPSGLKGRVQVPEGIVQIDEMAFCGCYQVTDLVLPASIETIPTSLFYTGYKWEELRSPVTFHLPEGSSLIPWFLENDISFELY